VTNCFQFRFNFAFKFDMRHYFKVLFYKLAGVDGRVSFQELSAGLAAGAYTRPLLSST
jgi:hypothetical protein